MSGPNPPRTATVHHLVPGMIRVVSATWAEPEPVLAGTTLGTVHGIRVFGFDDGKITSLNPNFYTYNPGWNTAEHNWIVSQSTPDHVVPGWNCACGFYACPSIDAVRIATGVEPERAETVAAYVAAYEKNLDWYELSRVERRIILGCPVTIFGIIEARGRVVEHELGFRAKEAKIVGLWVPSEFVRGKSSLRAWWEHAAPQWNVPVTTDWRDLNPWLSELSS